MIVYAVVDDTLSPASPLGDAIDVFVRRGDAERFIEEIRGDEPEAQGAAADRGTRARGRLTEEPTAPQASAPVFRPILVAQAEELGRKVGEAPSDGNS